jgi:hypothetical protein
MFFSDHLTLIKLRPLIIDNKEIKKLVDLYVSLNSNEKCIDKLRNIIK